MVSKVCVTPPMPPVPTRSRLLLPFDACHAPQARGTPIQSMFPTLTVQPGVKVVPDGILKLLHATPISKLPFWNGAHHDAPANVAKITPAASLFIVIPLSRDGGGRAPDDHVRAIPRLIAPLPQ